MNISLFPFAPENLVSRDGFGSPVPHQPAHLHTQAEPGAYLRDSSRVPRRRPFIYLNRPTPSGQSRVYRATQLRTDGVYCRESTGRGPVVLKVVPNRCCLGRSPWTNYYTPLFPTPTIGLKWACRKYRRFTFIGFKHLLLHKSSNSRRLSYVYVPLWESRRQGSERAESSRRARLRRDKKQQLNVWNGFMLVRKHVNLK